MKDGTPNILKINLQETVRTIVDFLKKEFKARRRKRAIIGLSGGIDSAVSACLCKLASLDLYVCLLPYKPQSWWKDEPNQGKNTELIIKALKIPPNRVISMDIASFVEPLFKNLEAVFNKNKIRFNRPFILTTLHSRERLNLIQFLAEYLNGLAVGTGNISESLLHYRTNFGHLSGDVQPVGNLFKTQIFDMAKYLKVPEKIIKEAVPSIEIRELKEKTFPVRYQEADPIIYLYLCNYSEEKAIKEFGFNKKIVHLIFKRVRYNSWLRKQEGFDQHYRLRKVGFFKLGRVNQAIHRLYQIDIEKIK